MTDTTQVSTVSFDDRGYALNAGTITIYDLNPMNMAGEPRQITISAGVTLPENSTMIAPPTAPQGQVAVWDKTSGQWELLADNRDVVVYEKTDSQNKSVYGKVGPIDSTYTTVPPTKPYQTFDDQTSQWVDNAALKQAYLLSTAKNITQNAPSVIWDNYGMYGETPPTDITQFLGAVRSFLQGKTTDLPDTPADLQALLDAKAHPSQQTQQSQSS